MLFSLAAFAVDFTTPSAVRLGDDIELSGTTVVDIQCPEGRFGPRPTTFEHMDARFTVSGVVENPCALEGWLGLRGGDGSVRWTAVSRHSVWAWGEFFTLFDETNQRPVPTTELDGGWTRIETSVGPIDVPPQEVVPRPSGFLAVSSERYALGEPVPINGWMLGCESISLEWVVGETVVPISAVCKEDGTFSSSLPPIEEPAVAEVRHPELGVVQYAVGRDRAFRNDERWTTTVPVACRTGRQHTPRPWRRRNDFECDRGLTDEFRVGRDGVDRVQSGSGKANVATRFDRDEQGLFLRVAALDETGSLVSLSEIGLQQHPGETYAYAIEHCDAVGLERVCRPTAEPSYINKMLVGVDESVAEEQFVVDFELPEWRPLTWREGDWLTTRWFGPGHHRLTVPTEVERGKNILDWTHSIDVVADVPARRAPVVKLGGGPMLQVMAAGEPVREQRVLVAALAADSQRDQEPPPDGVGWNRDAAEIPSRCFDGGHRFSCARDDAQPVFRYFARESALVRGFEWVMTDAEGRVPWPGEAHSVFVYVPGIDNMGRIDR